MKKAGALLLGYKIAPGPADDAKQNGRSPEGLQPGRLPSLVGGLQLSLTATLAALDGLVDLLAIVVEAPQKDPTLEAIEA
jgi:hypothetical protein